MILDLAALGRRRQLELSVSISLINIPTSLTLLAITIIVPCLPPNGQLSGG